MSTVPPAGTIESAMKIIQLHTIVCAECGRECRPDMNPLIGTIDLSSSGKVQYVHTANRDCPHSETVFRIHVGAYLSVEVIGKLDWTELPPTLKAVEPGDGL